MSTKTRKITSSASLKTLINTDSQVITDKEVTIVFRRIPETRVVESKEYAQLRQDTKHLHYHKATQSTSTTIMALLILRIEGIEGKAKP
jgi:hypothetical protein